MKNITLIIPAKNESESLPSVIKNLKKFKFKIMVVLHKNDKKTIKSIQKFRINIVYQNKSGYGDALIKGINKVAKKLKISVDTGKGYRALANISEHGGQEVPHLHFHLFGGERV